MMSNIEVQYSIGSLCYLPYEEYEKLCLMYEAPSIRLDTDPIFEDRFKYHFEDNDYNDRGFYYLYQDFNNFIHFPYIQYQEDIPVSEQIGQQIFERLGVFLSYLGGERTYLKDFFYKRVESLINTLATSEIPLEEYLTIENDLDSVWDPIEGRRDGHPSHIPKYLIINYLADSSVITSYDLNVSLLQKDTHQIVLLKELGILDYLNEEFQCIGQGLVDPELKQNANKFARLISLITKVNNVGSLRKLVEKIYRTPDKILTEKSISAAKSSLRDVGVKKS